MTLASALFAAAFGANVHAADVNADKQNLDQQIATCLLLGNQEEIALAQFAEKHAQHEQVKAFAKTLVAAHTKALAAIQKAAPEVADLQLASVNATSATADRSQPVGQAEKANPTALMQQVKSECLSLTEKELGQYSGVEFDHAFIGQQLGAHVGMLAQLRGSNSFASPELQKVIAEGEKMTTAHMAEAKKIMAQLKAAPKTANAAERSSR
jgi:predicted outer membrane protein